MSHAYRTCFSAADQPDRFIWLQRQIKSAYPKMCNRIRVGQCRIHTLFIDLNPEDGQVWVYTPETVGAFKRGAGVKAIAQVDEHRTLKQSIDPREKRWFVEQDKVIDSAKSIRSCLPTGP